MQERDARKGKKKAPKKDEKGFTKKCEACRKKRQKRTKRGLQRSVKRAEYIPGARESARAEEAADGRG